MPNKLVLSSEVDHNELQHYGVLGMKWGIRKSAYGPNAGRIKARATMTKQNQKDYAELSPLNNTTKRVTEAYDKTFKKAQRGIRKGIRKINRDPQYKGQKFKVDSFTRQQYYKEISRMATQQLNAAAQTGLFSRRGAVGKRLELVFDFDVQKSMAPTFTIREIDTAAGRRAQRREARQDLKQADPIKGYVVLDENGFVEDLELDVLEQSDTEEFLEHHGILGQKWGVRRFQKEDGRRTPAGKRRDAAREDDSEDSASARQNRSRGPRSLSNDELRRTNERMQLENTYRQLSAQQIQKGNNVVRDILARSATAAAGTIATAAMVGIGKKIFKELSPTLYAEAFPKDKKKDD